MSAIVIDLVDWTGGRDREGYLEFRPTWRVQASSKFDGPWSVAQAAGLPITGTPWVYGNDSHPWCFCMPDLTITKATGGSTTSTDIHELYWHVQQVFTNKPLKRCQDTQIENPLMEPAKLSGSYVKAVREMSRDRHGNPIKTSSHELIRGPGVEFDDSRPTVTIEMNTLLNQLSTFNDMVDTVNDAALWGLDPRYIKLSNATWTRKLYGVCTYFFTTVYEFEIHKRSWDRKLANEGSRCLIGHSVGSPCSPLDPDAADPDFPGMTYSQNPKRFEVYKDINGENARCMLDSKGRPLGPDDPLDEIDVEYYDESNFLLLGIPTTLD